MGTVCPANPNPFLSLPAARAALSDHVTGAPPDLAPATSAVNMTELRAAVAFAGLRSITVEVVVLPAIVTRSVSLSLPRRLSAALALR